MGKGFSLFGGAPTIGPSLNSSGDRVIPRKNKPARYVDPRRARLNRESLRIPAGKNPSTPKRLTSTTQPPTQPVVKMAKERDNVYFRKLAGVCGITPGMTPGETVKEIQDNFWQLKAPGVLLHRCSSNAVLFHLTLITPAGFSKFEGTTEQFLNAFPPLPAE